MIQSVILAIVLIGAAGFLIRHFAAVFRTGRDCSCSGCALGCCSEKPLKDNTLHCSRSESAGE